MTEQISTIKQDILRRLTKDLDKAKRKQELAKTQIILLEDQIKHIRDSKEL